MSESARLTEDDIRKLPRWPRAAFAVRCARRAEAVFGEAYPDCPIEFLRTFDEVLRLAEEACSHAKAPAGLETALNLASSLLPNLRPEATYADDAFSRVEFVRWRCADGLIMAVKAVRMADLGSDEMCTKWAYQAYNMFKVAAENLAGLPERVSVLRKDYEVLRQAAEAGKLKDDSPVWPQFYGLKKEAETYYRELPRMVAEGREGQWVLIEGDRIVAFFDEHPAALQAGYQRIGLSHPFLVKQVQADEKPIFLRY